MSSMDEKKEAAGYGEKFRPERDVKVIKKDGSLESFNVQKVIDAVGKSAYRALTKFTEDEKKHICQYVIDKVNELEQDQIPIPIMHNIVAVSYTHLDVYKRQVKELCLG